MSKEELTEEYMNKLAKKYNVKDWWWISSNTMTDDNNKIISVQMVSNVEELFKLGEGKVVNVHGKRYPKFGGIITDD
jgi:hypothetical protein